MEEMKKFIKGLLGDESKGELFRLEMIDNVERLGLGYNVEKEIKDSIDSIISNSDMFQTCNIWTKVFMLLPFGLGYLENMESRSPQVQLIYISRI